MVTLYTCLVMRNLSRLNALRGATKTLLVAIAAGKNATSLVALLMLAVNM